MKILLIGSGGREHALAWKLAQSPHCGRLFCAPGNPGIGQYAECVDIAVDDIDGLAAYASQHGIEFVVVGPETPLVLGLADRLRGAGIAVFGPSRDAAQLEGSKAFMKELCGRHGIPTAGFGVFTDIQDAKDFIGKLGCPIVVKADGLAAGKGVIIAQSEQAALAAVEDMLSGNQFGAAGHRVVIEEFLQGEEISFFALTDGQTTVPLISAQDHKRVGDGDTGPNTGGMGAYAPANPRIMTAELQDRVMRDIILPTVAALRKDGHDYSGVLFAGLMVKDGVPKLLEYNCRFGDPECQAIMSLLDGDLVTLLHGCAVGTLGAAAGEARWRDGAALCVVMAANGYPGSTIGGTAIRGLDRAETVEGVKIFHAGTALNDKGALVAKGGRVLGVTATGPTVGDAKARAYQSVDLIDWPEGFCRRDIGWRAL